jgi:hypothetical protein
MKDRPRGTATSRPSTAISLLSRQRDWCFGSEISWGRHVSPGKDKPPLPLSHEHHLECRSCHGRFRLPGCELSDTERNLERLGFREVTHDLTFKGVCEKCWASDRLNILPKSVDKRN